MLSSLLTSLSRIFSGINIPTAVAATVLIITITFLWLLRTGSVNPKEPPLAHSWIPLVGHLIGILWHQNRYLTILSDQNPWPIYTLKIFSTRIYIIASPNLAQAAFRNSKEIDFDTVKLNASCKALAFDQHATDIICYEPKKGENSYILDLHQEMYAALAQGPSLLQTNARVLNCLTKSLNAVGTTQQPKNLFRWMRDFYTVGSAEALYGPQNPISENHNLIQPVWDFEKDLGMLILDFLPSITAPKGYAARLTIGTAFEKYYNQGLDKNASGFVQGRARCARKWGLTTEEISRAETSIIFAAVTNTVPNVFYMLCYIFSDVELVAAIREETAKIITQQISDKAKLVSLDIAMLQTHCPLLTACFYETLRLIKTGASVRTTLSDVMLDDQYLLRKGAVIQIPTGVLQSDISTWGKDAQAFNPRRFIEKESLLKEAKKLQTQAFIPFGGGKNLCPGRHLAFTEITAFAAMMVYGFELTMSDGGVVQVPEPEFQRLGISSMSPKKDLAVLIRRREEFEGVMWQFETGNGDDLSSI